MTKEITLLSLIDDPTEQLPSVTGYTIQQADSQLVEYFNQYVLNSRTVFKLMDGYPAIINAIVAHERKHNHGKRYDGLVLRNRNINTSCLFYLMGRFKEAGYGLAFSEQKRAHPGSNTFIPSYLITFDFK
jgi:hypothetical protein